MRHRLLPPGYDSKGKRKGELDKRIQSKDNFFFLEWRPNVWNGWIKVNGVGKLKNILARSILVEECSREDWREQDQKYMQRNYPSKKGTKEKAGKEKQNTVDQYWSIRQPTNHTWLLRIY